MIGDVIRRAIELNVPQLLIEFETLPDMTIRPEWALEINRHSTADYRLKTVSL